MSEGLAIAIAVLIFVVITIAKGVRLVAQGEEWVVERLGKYHATLRPGLNILIPYLDRVAYKLVTKDIILDVQEQEVITRDNAVILTNAIAFVKVTDPVKAVYGVTDFSEAIRNLIMTIVVPLALFIWFIIAFLWDGNSWKNLRNEYRPLDPVKYEQKAEPATHEGGLK